MRDRARRILTAFLTVVFSLNLYIGVYAKSDWQTAASKRVVSGTAYSGTAGLQVAISVYKDGYDSEIWKNSDASLDALLYFDQTETGEDGAFEFLVPINEMTAACTALIRVEDESEPRVVSITPNEAFFVDFEDYEGGAYDAWSEMTAPYNRYAKVNIDDEHGTSMKLMPTSGSCRLFKFFDTEIDSGVHMISFDFRADSLDNMTYIRLLTSEFKEVNQENDKYMLESFVANKGGRLGYYQNTTGWNILPSGDNALSYEADKWYTVDMWIDSDRDKVNYFINNEFIGETDIADMSLKGFLVNVSENTFASGKGVNIDNFTVDEMTHERVLARLRAGLSVPEYLKDNIVLTISSNKTGNTFFNGEDIYLDCAVLNRSDTSASLDVDIEIKDDNGDVVWSDSKSVYAKAKSNYSLNIHPIGLAYGVYDLTVTARDSSNVYSASTRLARSVYAKQVNPKIGTNTHFDRGRGAVEPNMPLIRAAGFGITRDTWNWLEDADWKEGDDPDNRYIEYGNKFKNYINMSGELGVDLMPILTIANSKYKDEDGGLDTSDTGLDAIEDFAEYFARTYGDRVEYVEIGNEYNLKTTSTTEDYVKVLKRCYTGLKKGNPNIKVVAFATSTIKDISKNFIRDTVEKYGAAGYFDAISVHPYHTTNMPEGISYLGYTWEGYVKSFKTFLYLLGLNYPELKDVELWATEIGYYTDGDKYKTSEVEQAAYCIRNAAINDANDFFDRLIFYDFQDDGNDKSYLEHNWGNIYTWKDTETLYGAKASYPAFANFNNLTAGSTAATKTVDGDVYSVKYDMPSDNELIMAWCTSGDKSATFNLSGAEFVEIYDMYGNMRTYETDDGSITVTLGCKPMYIKPTDACVAVLKNGATVGDASEIKSGDKICIKAHTAESKSKMVVYVAYRGDVPIEIQYKSLSASEDSTNIKIGENPEHIEVFLWSDDGQIIPYCNRYEL